MDASVVNPETMTAVATAATVTATVVSAELIATAAPLVEKAMEVGTREAMVVAAGLAAILKGALDAFKRFTGLLDGNRLARVLVVCAVLSLAVFVLNQVALGTDVWAALVMAGGPWGAILVDQVVSSHGRRKVRDEALAYLNTRLKDSEKDG